MAPPSPVRGCAHVAAAAAGLAEGRVPIADNSWVALAGVQSPFVVVVCLRHLRLSTLWRPIRAQYEAIKRKQ